MTKHLFKIYHFYKKELNLYGDNGNILYLQHFLKLFNISSKVYSINSFSTNLEPCDFIFAGGGPDLLQNKIYENFLTHQKFILNHIKSGKPSLFVCGSFQLLGKYYLTDKNLKIPGLSLFNFYTFSPKNQNFRIVGNVHSKINFNNNIFPKKIVGFENHNGRTVLAKSLQPLSYVDSLKKGNNTQDYSEGLLYKKTIGTYLHGPVLVKNPLILSYLLSEFINIKNLEEKKVFSSEYVAYKNASFKKR